MKKLKNTELKLKKSATYKKVCNSLIMKVVKFNLSFLREILLKCFFHYIVLN